ncbi:N-acetyltransferase B complex, non-catalytic subunit [Ophiocordyceps camponoti-floridani]|uniref:N-acetyltransferase B complex, non-catalytic subunit n=1 Tax=Ophiocordyceps camponoti-floridani TaxID=2030778 RepID=A0A8H4Q3A4_9HYPO|nr:N-acetyltransferase B complex, non-catalytic subunit [Ophiocordyceps camponoti-floridani]
MSRSRPRLRNGVDLQLQTAFQDGNWPVAMRLAEKRARASQDGYFEVVKVCAESQLPDPGAKFAALAEVDRLVRDEAGLRDADALDLLEWATVDLMDEHDYLDTLGPLRVRAVKAAPKDRVAVTRCLESCLLHWDLVSAQQIAAILDRSFPADRSFLFWNVVITHMLSTSDQCPAEKQKLYSMLSLKQMERAAQLTEQAENPQQPPSRGIQTEQEISLLYEIVERHGAAADMDKVLASPVFGPVPQFRLGRKEPLFIAVEIYRRRADWDAVFNLCCDCLEDVDDKDEPTLLACDWRIWRHVIEAAGHLGSVRHDVAEIVQRLLLRLLRSGNMRPMYRRNLLLARVSAVFHLVSGDDEDLHGDQPSSLRLRELIRYVEDQKNSSACFDDIKGLVEELSGPAARFLAYNLVPRMAEAEADKTTAARLRLLSLKLRYFVCTCPVSKVRVPGRRPASACAVCDGTFDGALCPRCLSSIGRDALGLYSETSGRATNKEISAGLSLVAAFCNLRLAFNAPKTSSKHLLRALFILERQLRVTPEQAALSLMLVQLHLHLGSAHRAHDIWDGLAVKRTTADSLAPLFLDRLSTVAPAMLSPSDGAGRQLVEMLHSHYQTSLRLRMPRRLLDAFEAGSYGSLTGIPRWVEQLRASCTRAMSLVEESRTGRMLGLSSRGVLGDARFHAVSDEVCLYGLIDYGSFPVWESSSCVPLYALLRIGPPPSNDRFHLALLTEAFYDVLDHKSVGKGSDHIFVREMMAQLGHSMTKFLHGGRLVGCTTAETTHYEAVSVLCALVSLCTASSPRPGSLPEALGPLTRSLRAAMDDDGGEGGEGDVEAVVDGLRGLHRLAVMRDTASAVRLATRWILEFHHGREKALSREAGSLIKALREAAEKALGRGRERARGLGVRSWLGMRSGGLRIGPIRFLRYANALQTPSPHPSLPPFSKCPLSRVLKAPFSEEGNVKPPVRNRNLEPFVRFYALFFHRRSDSLAAPSLKR